MTEDNARATDYGIQGFEFPAAAPGCRGHGEQRRALGKHSPDGDKRATALAFAREGVSVTGCDVTVEPAGSNVDMVGGAGGEMVSDWGPAKPTQPNGDPR
jgi:hypothetical protein